jgi:hypothetical protein
MHGDGSCWSAQVNEALVRLQCDPIYRRFVVGQPSVHAIDMGAFMTQLTARLGRVWDRAQGLDPRAEVLLT